MDESGTDVTRCCRRVASERKVAGANARDLELKCATLRIVHACSVAWQ